MKLEIKSKEKDWHKWFAWFPVTVMENDREFIVWFENIERKKWIGNGYLFSSYRFIRNLPKCYCLCKNEILQDEYSVFYEVGTHTNIICSKCGVQTSWDLNAPVPLFLNSTK